MTGGGRGSSSNPAARGGNINSVEAAAWWWTFINKFGFVLEISSCNTKITHRSGNVTSHRNLARCNNQRQEKKNLKFYQNVMGRREERVAKVKLVMISGRKMQTAHVDWQEIGAVAASDGDGLEQTRAWNTNLKTYICYNLVHIYTQLTKISWFLQFLPLN